MAYNPINEVMGVLDSHFTPIISPEEVRKGDDNFILSWESDEDAAYSPTQFIRYYNMKFEVQLVNRRDNNDLHTAIENIGSSVPTLADYQRQSLTTMTDPVERGNVRSCVATFTLERLERYA